MSGRLVPVAKADRHDAQLALGAGGIATATGSNRIQWTLNERKIRQGRRKVGEAELNLNRAKQAPKAKPPRSTWAQGPMSAGANRRGANRERAKTIKTAQGRVNDARAFLNKPAVTRTHVNALTLGGMTVGGLGLWRGARGKVEKATKQDVDVAAAGTVGGAAAYYGASYGTKRIDRKYAEKIKSDPKHSARYAQHQADYRVDGGTKAGAREWTAFHRNYPKDLPGARYKRAMSYTHGGKAGLAVAGASMAGGGTLALQAKKKRVEKSQYGPYTQRKGKDLYTRERRTNPVRVFGVGAGAGLVAYGGSRSGILAGTLAYGQRSAPNQFLRDASRVADNVRGKTEKITGQAAAGLGRRLPGFARELTRVPHRYRPTVALLTGATMMRSSRPVTRDHYKPYAVQGW